MTADDVRRLIRGRMNEPGSGPIWQKDFAAAAGVSPAFLSDVLKGRREPSGPLLDYLGLVRVVSYAPHPRVLSGSRCAVPPCKFCDSSGDCKKIAWPAALETEYSQVPSVE
jgi:transcriptional regulator with XRE-family HTH domain